MVAAVVALAPGAYGGEPARSVSASPWDSSRVWRMEDLLPPQSLKATQTESASVWSERHTTGVMSRMTKSQSGQNQALKGFYDRQGIISEQDQKFRVAALKDIKQSEFREQRDLSRYLLTQLGKALGEHARDKSPFLRSLGQGLAFNLDTHGVTSTSNQNAANAQVRYGLVLKQVKPSGQGVHVAALTMDDSYLEHVLASKHKAQIDWTIGPLLENNETLLFRDIDSASSLDASHATKAQGIFGMRPDFSLRGKVEPNFAADSPGKLGFRLRFEQPQGLYRMEMLTGGAAHTAQMMHEMRLPVYGGLVLVRQINSSMIATKTSALNMFGFSEILGQYPINVHYVHADSSLKAETGFKLIDGRLGVEANVANLHNNHTSSIGSCAINYARGF